MAIDKDTKKRLKLLLEYSIKRGVELQEAEDESEDSNVTNITKTDQIPTSSPNSNNISDIFNDEEIPGPKKSIDSKETTTKPSDEENSEEPNESEDENDEITIISKILKRHSEKLDDISKFADEFNSKIGELKRVTEKQNEELYNQAQKIKKLTPLTPLESLENIIKLTPGAKSVQEYWNENLIKNGQDDEKVAISDENGIKVKIKDLPKYSEKQIQDSLFESTQKFLDKIKNY